MLALKDEAEGVFTPMTRKEFLTLASKYLTQKQVQTLPKAYLDLEPDSEVLVANAL